MITLFATIDNAIPMQTPILDDTQTDGYRLEDRLQVTVKSLANDKLFTVEFRIGEGYDTPGMDQLNTWMDAGEPVRVVCSDITPRPFVHDPNKEYRNRGAVKQINGQDITLDTLIILPGLSIEPANTAFNLDDEVRKARGLFKKQQRAYREQRNAERLTKMQQEMPERIAKMKAKREADAKAKAKTDTTAAPPADAARRR